METGTIRRLINKPAAEEGGNASVFGFIRSEAGEDRFFLPSTLAVPESKSVPTSLLQAEAWDTLRIGDRVTFTPEQHPRGMRAVNVSVVRQ